MLEWACAKPERGSPIGTGRARAAMARLSWLGTILASATVALLTLLAVLVSTRCYTCPSAQHYAAILASLWQVEAGIAAIALPLLILVTQFATDEKQLALSLPSILTRASGLFQTAVFATVAVATVGFLAAWAPDRLGFAVGLSVFCVSLSLLVLAAWRLFQVLLDPTEQKRLAREQLRQRVRRSVEAEAELRVRRARLAAELAESDIGVPEFFSPTTECLRLAIKLDDSEPRVIAHVDVGRLRKVTRNLPWLRASSDTTPSADAVPEKAGSVVFVVNIGDYLNPVKSEILRIKAGALDATALEGESAGQIVYLADLQTVVRLEQPDVFFGQRNRLKDQLEHIRGVVLEAMRTRKAPEVTDALGSYLLVHGEFISKYNDLARKHGSTLSEGAPRPLFDRWDETDWLGDDLRDFILLAEEMGSYSLDMALLDFIVQLAHTDLRLSDPEPPDPNAFAGSLRYAQHLYSTTNSLEPAVRARLASVIAQRLAETGEYYVPVKAGVVGDESTDDPIARCGVSIGAGGESSSSQDEPLPAGVSLNDICQSRGF
jgi:hypothetical protein